MGSAVDARPVALQARLVPFQRQVQRHLLAMVKDAALAEELAQDTYARALARIDQLRDPQAALAWLYRIATTVALDRLRQRPRAAIPLDENNLAAQAEQTADASPPALVEGSLERSEMSDCVDGYLASLPDDYRIAILLHDAHGLTNAEIAQLVGCSLATAKIRVHRARERLRQTLSTACNFEIDDRGVLVCEPRPARPTEP